VVNNWVITGGCGFIGTSLIAKILHFNPKSNIIVLDNLSVGSREDLSEVCNFTECTLEDKVGVNGVSLIVSDILDAKACQLLTESSDCIVHLAANTGVGPSVENPRMDMEANVIGTFNLLEGARINGIKKFIFASSGAPAGVVEPPIHEELAPHPVSPYGASKLAGEGYCSAFFQTFGVNTIALRFGNVYGPRSKNKSSVVAKFIQQALKNVECQVYGDGSQTRDFIYIDDLIEAILKASECNYGGETYQVATGSELSLNQLLAVLRPVFEEITGQSMKIAFGEKRLGDVMRNYSDTSKALSHLGWSSSTSLKDGLAKTVTSLLRDNHNNIA